MPAPYSYSTTVASGSTNVVSVPFPYIAKADVHVTIDTVEVTDLTWTTDSTIQLASSPALGAVVKAYRDTPKDVLSVNWSSPSVLAESDIEKAFTQLLYIAQEAYDLGILPRVELDAAINYVNTALNSAQAALDATNVAKDSAVTTIDDLVTTAQTAATSAQNSADAAALIAEFTPSDYFQKANLLSEVTGDADKAAARTNIGAIDAAGVDAIAVRYDAAQALNDTQKGTARSNIGAFPSIGGTISGTMTATGKITAQAGLDVTNGVLFLYGYGGSNTTGIQYFTSTGSAYLYYGLGGVDYFLFNKHVYSPAGRLWGSQDFALSALGSSNFRWVSGGSGGVGTFRDLSPYLLSGISMSGASITGVYTRYLQYYLNGTWYVVGFA